MFFEYIVYVSVRVCVVFILEEFFLIFSRFIFVLNHELVVVVGCVHWLLFFHRGSIRGTT